MTSSSVYFYTGGFTHTFYRHQYACSPSGWQMIPSTPDLLDEGIKEDIPAMGTWRGRANRAAKATAIATLRLLRVPNVRRVGSAADLVHSAEHLLVTRRPWVADFEDCSVFFWYRRRLLHDPVARRVVRRLMASDRCRRLLPWTEASKQSLVKAIGDPAIIDKAEVVYPAIANPPPSPNKPASKKEVRMLFVGTRFYVKGGLETLRVFRRLRRSHPVELTMVTILPPELTSEVSALDGVTILSKITPERLAAEFESADVFVLPVHIDTFGFVYLEAFSYGIPCVGPKHFAVPEIIDDGRTGLIVPGENSYFGADRLPQFDPVLHDRHPLIERIKEPTDRYVEGLEEAIGRVIEDAALRKDMGEAAYEEIRAGRFSCARRRETMGRVYAEALDDG